MTIKHPAKFTDSVLDKITGLLDSYGWPERILDPFAGTGRVHWLPGRRLTETCRYCRCDLTECRKFAVDTANRCCNECGQHGGHGPVTTIGTELEPEWAALHPRTVVGNALHLPFDAATFDGMCTSPCYGNRFADSHNAQDGSRRRSYTHDIGRRLHADNAGAMQWGDKYRAFHDRAWLEALRVLQPDSLIVLNISNHIRGGEEQLVAEWHMNWFMDHGCFVEDVEAVATPRLRDGANAGARPKAEYVFALRYVAPVYTPEEEISDVDDELELAPHGTGLADDLDTTEGCLGA